MCVFQSFLRKVEVLYQIVCYVTYEAKQSYHQEVALQLLSRNPSFPYLPPQTIPICTQIDRKPSLSPLYLLTFLPFIKKWLSSQYWLFSMLLILDNLFFCYTLWIRVTAKCLKCKHLMISLNGFQLSDVPVAIGDRW